MTPTEGPAAKANANRTFLNIALLGGTMDQNVAAAHAAGFDQVELCRDDVEVDGGTVETVVRSLRDLVNFTLVSAWQCVRRVHEPNLGLVVNAFHMFASGGHARDLDGIPTEAVFLVQLSDLDRGVDFQHVAQTARHHELLPGQGHFPLWSLVDRLREREYRGPIGVDVFNDALKARDPKEVANEAMAALRMVCRACSEVTKP